MVRRHEIKKLFNLLILGQTRCPGHLDSPEAAKIHKEIINSKPFLKRIYRDYYLELLSSVGKESKIVVELGSGGGFIKELRPGVTTSDVLDLSCVDMRFSATDMPFEKSSIDAFLMVDVFHHIPDIRRFLGEADRCLKKGGIIAMIEPANTVWSRIVYKRFHHEKFDTGAGWTLPEGGGPLSNANGALPWIVFHRDRTVFERAFPGLRIKRMRIHTPILYIASGGFTLKQLVPSFLYPVFKFCETVLSPLNPLIGMFETVVIEKK